MIMFKKIMQPLSQAWGKTEILEKKPWWPKASRTLFPEIHLENLVSITSKCDFSANETVSEVTNWASMWFYKNLVDPQFNIIDVLIKKGKTELSN